MLVDQFEAAGYFKLMNAAEIIDQVQKLPAAQVFELGRWLRGYESELWDKQIEADLKAGKLDHLAQEALGEARAGKTRPFPE